jgi:hypothetical protein
MSETRETPDDETLRRLASGEAPLSDEATHAMWCAAEVLRLRAVIEGRTTPPTREEIEAHHMAGGAWLVLWSCRGLSHGRWRDGVLSAYIFECDVTDMCKKDARWLALDASGRPCAWPEVAR